MHHIMFDVDGTLVESFEFDEECYMSAVFQVLGQEVDCNWSDYPHVSDAGILDEHLLRHGLLDKRDKVHAMVKLAFIENINQQLKHTPVSQVAGAAEFVSFLKDQNDISLSIATGGWGETARLKLDSAGIDVSGIPLASSNDHYARTEIMRAALAKAEVHPDYKLTYFGDADWDKKACADLGFNFVLVGGRTTHDQTVSDFTAVKDACRFIGL